MGLHSAYSAKVKGAVEPERVAIDYPDLFKMRGIVYVNEFAFSYYAKVEGAVEPDRVAIDYPDLLK